MPVGKLQRFKQLSRFENTLELTDFQDNKSEKPKGRWHSDIFGNNQPIVLELGCGKGTYTLELARKNPQQNFIGIDIKGSRIWKGAKRALDEGLENVRFMRMYVDHLDEYFGPAEVDDIWITFPDPYPKGSNRSKRLTSPKFLNVYQKVLKPGGHVRLKTDSNQLFDYTRGVVQKIDASVSHLVENIYQECPNEELLTIKTDFEKSHLAEGRTISFIKYTLPKEPILDF